MDIARRTYKRACRFLRDNAVVSTVRWKDARHDAETLGRESIILCSDFEPDKWLPAPVGEVFDAPYEFRLGVSPINSGRGHVCGTDEDFAQGGLYEPDLPPVRYAANGLPLCCDPVFRVRGGAAGGGRSAYAVIPGFHVYGGAGGGGRSAYMSAFVDPTTGGGEGGGSAGDVLAFIDAPAGGGEGGGSAGDVLAFIDAPAGGGEGGGAAGDVLAFVDAPAGGGEGGGNAVGNVVAFVDATTGGGEGGGAAGDVIRFTDAPSGGGEGGGAAVGDVFIPPITPGSSCAAAGTLPLGTTYNGTIPAMMVQQWFKFTATVSGAMHVATTGIPAFGVGVTIMQGGSCPAPTPVSPTTFGPPRWVWTATAGAQCWLKIEGFGASGSYTVVVDTGP